MINKKNLEMNVYDYFKYCVNNSIRGVSVVTDKQCIFYTQVDNDNCTHEQLCAKIENEIHPDNKKEGLQSLRKNNTYVTSLGKELTIFLPKNWLFSLSQFKFLEKLLNQIDKYNKDYNKEVLIYVHFPTSLSKRLKTTSIEEAKRVLYKAVTREIVFDKELIIGTTLSLDEQVECMKYNIDLETCDILIDLLVSISRCRKYYEDEFYRENFKRIFPNFEKIELILKNIVKLYDEELDVSGVNYSNIEEVLCSKINKRKL